MPRSVPLCARALPTLAAAAIALVVGGCGGATDFDAARARSHIDALAGAIGNRLVGSEPAARAREYLIDQLERAGFTVRLQRADAVDDRRGLTVPVVNIIASRTGAEEGAIALTSHYDSAPDAPGGLDDALGVAVCLEAGRVLAALPLRHSLFVIITDGEEAGLMGARAAIRDPELASRLRAFLNFDGTGAAGPALLFEAGVGRNGESALSAWGAGAPRAEGGSFSTEIYRRLPNDTDFTILRSLGIAGLNFAPVGDSYAYHTDRDTAARVRIETIHHAVINTVGIIRRLDRDGLDVTSEPTTFFDVAGRGVSYGPPVATVLAWTAALLGLVVWIPLSRAMWQPRGFAGLPLTVAWALATVAAIAGAMVGAGLALQAGRTEVHFWYASPHWFFAATIGAGLLAWLLMSAIARRVPFRFSPIRSPLAAWWLALPVWIALAVALQATAAAASYLVSLPLIVAAVSLIVARGRDIPTRISSAIVLAVAAHFWVSDTLLLLSFMVPLFGRMPIVPPVWAFAALMLAALALCGPPVAAVAAGRRPRHAAIAVFAAGVVTLAALAAGADAYSDDRPQRRMLRYVQDDVAQRAWWEQGGPEPDLAVDPSAEMGQWESAENQPPMAIRIGQVAGRFRHRVEARPLAAPPADVRARVTRLDDVVALAVSIRAKEYLWATIVLPVGIAPRESSLAGIVSGGQWRATYVAPAGSHFEVRLLIDGRDAAAVVRTAVLLNTYAVPDAAAGRRVPAWAPAENITWQPRGLYVLAVSPEPLTDVPSGRR